MYLPPVVSFHLHTEYRKELSVKKIVLSALALVAAAGVANAQAPNFRLDVNLFGRQYSPVDADLITQATNVASGVIVSNAAGSNNIIRLEGRYRLFGVGSTNGVYGAGTTAQSSGGLAAASLNLASSLSLSPGSLRAAASANPATSFGTSATFPNPQDIDTTNAPGLYAPFRTGVFIDVPAGTGLGNSNGDFSANGLTNILPITTSAPDHRSGSSSNGLFWGLFAVDFNPTGLAAGQYTFTVSQTGVAQYYPRIGTANASAAIESQGGFQGSSFTVSVIPAPGAAALLGLGGLLVARRRRA